MPFVCGKWGESVDHEFPVIEVSGDSYQMGYEHGAQASDLIRKYLLWIEHLTGRTRDVLCRNAMALLPSMEALSPPFVDEVRGLAAGADIALEEAVLCQARAEAAEADDSACSAFALTGAATTGGRTLAGQNQDLQPEYADVAILLRVRPTDERPMALMFTFAGQLGYSGMNEHGVAHFANALYAFDWRPGLPHYPLKRVMLEQTNVHDCLALLSRHRTCSAANVVLCDAEGSIADVEVRPEGIARLRDQDADACLHTNHYVTSEFSKHGACGLPDSVPRLSRLRALVQAKWGTITVETLKSMLADHEGDPGGICRHGAEGMHSVSGYIADAAERTLHVRRGHGCLGTWRSYTL